MTDEEWMDAMREEHEQLLEALKRLMLELPVYRDWLNPRTEKMCLDAIEKADGEPLRLETKRFG
jgi:hypothetical protein